MQRAIPQRTFKHFCRVSFFAFEFSSTPLWRPNHQAIGMRYSHSSYYPHAVRIGTLFISKLGQVSTLVTPYISSFKERYQVELIGQM